jgi:nitroreductase
MEFSDVIRRRRMVRNFTEQPIPFAALERILAAGRRGPSAGFTQGQDFIVIQDSQMKASVAELCGEVVYIQMGYDPFISRAPVLIIPCTSEAAYHRRYQEPDKILDEGSEIEWPVPFWFMDGGCAVMLILLAVVNEGLAAGFAGIQDTERMRDMFHIPQEITPLGVIPIGYPAPDKPSTSLKRGHRPEKQVVHWEHW